MPYREFFLFLRGGLSDYLVLNALEHRNKGLVQIFQLDLCLLFWQYYLVLSFAAFLQMLVNKSSVRQVLDQVFLL
jgi:hypothetical protein